MLAKQPVNIGEIKISMSRNINKKIVLSHRVVFQRVWCHDSLKHEIKTQQTF